MSYHHNSTFIPLRERINPPAACHTCETANPFPTETQDSALSTVKLRKRPIAGGGYQYRWQCQVCGHSVANAVSQKTVLSIKGQEPPVFDEALLENWQQKKASERLDLQRLWQEVREFETEEFRRWYSAYLLTPRWRTKRQAVIKRCSDTCEGCGKYSVDEVHHLTYQHVGNEFLWELIGICDFCHTRVHAELKTDWQSINPFPVQGAAS